MSCFAIITVTWHEAAAVKKASDAERIPVDWRLPANAYKDLKNVMSVPTTCGILSPREIKITELDNVELLLKYMASGEWSAEEVATAVRTALYTIGMIATLKRYNIRSSASGQPSPISSQTVFPNSGSTMPSLAPKSLTRSDKDQDQSELFMDCPYH